MPYNGVNQVHQTVER